MAITSPKLGLRVWNSLQDPYDHDQLASNWFKIDQHDHSPGRGVQIPSEGIFDGAITEEKLDPDLLERIPSDPGAISAAAAPTGSIIGFAGSTAPAGWLICNGATVSRTQYAALFAVIGTTYGTGDGTTSTFSLPDTQNRVLLGVSPTRRLGATGGEETHKLTISEMPSHNHGGLTGGMNRNNPHTHASTGLQPLSTPGGSVNFDRPFGGANVGSTDINHQHSISSQGGDAAHNIMQPYIATFQIIKF